MLEFWGMCSTLSLLLLSWSRMVAPDKVLSMGQIELFTFKLSANK